MFSTIASAYHEILIRSGNAAYASVNALHLQAKCELQAQRYVPTRSSYMHIQLIVSLLELSFHSCRM